MTYTHTCPTWRAFVVGSACAQAPLSMFPRTALTGATVRKASRSAAPPMSPACTISSEPRSAWTAAGRSRPWVSAIRPTRRLVNGHQPEETAARPGKQQFRLSGFDGADKVFSGRSGFGAPAGTTCRAPHPGKGRRGAPSVVCLRRWGRGAIAASWDKFACVRRIRIGIRPAIGSSLDRRSAAECLCRKALRRPRFAPLLLFSGSGIDDRFHFRDSAHREASAAGVLSNNLFVRSDVDTIDLVPCHVAVDPLNLRTKVSEHVAGYLRHTLQIRRR